MIAAYDNHSPHHQTAADSLDAGTRSRALDEALLHDLVTQPDDLSAHASRHQLSITELAQWATQTRQIDAMNHLADLADRQAQVLLSRSRMSAVARLIELSQDDSLRELSRKASVDLLKCDLRKRKRPARRNKLSQPRTRCHTLPRLDVEALRQTIEHVPGSWGYRPKPVSPPVEAKLSRSRLEVEIDRASSRVKYFSPRAATVRERILHKDSVTIGKALRADSSVESVHANINGKISRQTPTPPKKQVDEKRAVDQGHDLVAITQPGLTDPAPSRSRLVGSEGETLTPPEKVVCETTTAPVNATIQRSCSPISACPLILFGMTQIAASIMVDSLPQAHATAARAGEEGADLAEYRIDAFDDGPGEMVELVENSPLPCILTCRSSDEGGLFGGNEDERLQKYALACSGRQKPAYIDYELKAWLGDGELREFVKRELIRGDEQSQSDRPGLILSTHDFDGRPRDLLQRIQAMADEPACHVIKFAYRARSLRDNLEAFELLQMRTKPMVALCMEDVGQPSRILAKKFGGFLTFASSSVGKGTAPGQATIAQLKQGYRWDKLSAKTQVFGVIGHPVAHSMSPAIHNAGFDAIDFPGVYLLMPIPPEYEHFKATVSTWLAMESLQFNGASVTIPHKENLLRFVREQGGKIEPLAEQIGAANTLTRRADGSLYASNTDYAAALDAVCDGMDIPRTQLAGKRVAVIGAGGAARAVVAGFAAAGGTVVVYNRTLDRAEALANEFNGSPGKVVAARMEKLCDSCCEIYINCTPIGMHPNVDASPMEEVPEGVVVFDTIYNPIETKLLRDAKERGCIAISGTEMFVRQAVGQFELWTQRTAPAEVFEKVMLERLKQ